MSKNANLKGLAQYILLRVSKKSLGKRPSLVTRRNQTMNLSSEKTGDVIVQEIDSMALRKSVVFRKSAETLI